MLKPMGTEWHLEKGAASEGDALWHVRGSWRDGHGEGSATSLVALMEAVLPQALGGDFELLDFRLACLAMGPRPDALRAVRVGGGRSIGFVEVEFLAEGTLLATARATVRRC